MIKKLTPVILFLLASNADAASLSETADSAKEFINKTNQKAPFSSDLKSAVPGYVDSSPSETGYGTGSMSDTAREKALTDPAAQFINKAYTTRPDIQIDKNTSPIFTKSNTVQNNPTSIVNSLTGHYGDCEAGTSTTVNNAEIRTCDEYTQVSEKSCKVGETVTVDAQHQYQCNKTRIYNDYTCNRTLALTCETIGGDAGLIKRTSGPNFMKWTYSYPDITIFADYQKGFPTSSYEYESAVGTHTANVYLYDLVFNISDLEHVTKFSLTGAYYQQINDVKINGHQIYSYDGNVSTLGYTGNRVSKPINLLPYLVAGSNKLTISNTDKVLGPYNEINPLTLVFSTTQTGCSKWNEVWTDSCGEYK